MLQLCLLHSRGRCCHAVLCHRHCCCMAMVGISLWLCLLCGHMVGVVSSCCVAGAVIAWLWWASCCSCVCCVAAVGVVTPCCVAVAMGITPHGVTVAVAALQGGVMVVVVTLHVVSLHCMVPHS
jgi:hypothetical protein